MEDLVRSLRALSERRFETFGALPLAAFEQAAEPFSAVPAPVVAGLHRERARIAALLAPERSEGLLAHHVDGFARACLRRQQFLVLGDPERRRIRGVYVRLFAGLRRALVGAASEAALETRLRAVLRAHHRALTGLSRELLLAQLGRTDGEPVCHEYAPELQLAVLDLAPESLLEPVLDLGCGEHAGLVGYLRARGVEAVGLDRAVRSGEGRIAGDWLRAPLGRERWGTVLSHMAFSNHFVHHHHRRHGQAALYARRTLAILRALRPGGRFVYAPGLPFFEGLLPQAGYAMHRHPIRALSGAAGSGPYASHVRRRR